jgi:glycerophosphoryl diester phosphodiesterase
MVKWISHRGESHDAPENTLAAFKLSLERNTDGMECDVHLTADGKVAVAHDNSTWRMGSRAVLVESSSYAELQEINVSSGFEKTYPGEKIPLLSETFRYLGAKREYYIELKGSNLELVPAVAAVVRDSGIPAEQIVFISFKEELTRAVKIAMPQCRVLWLKTLVTADGIMSPEELVAKLDELGADGVDANGQIEIGAEWIDAVHRAGKIFAVWTIDNPWQAERFISLGVDSITSNRAAMLRDLLKQED